MAHTKKYYLKYDRVNYHGSPENFFHFMWGYLLPSFNFVLSIQKEHKIVSEPIEFIFTSCGEVMDSRMADLLSLTKVKFSIEKKDWSPEDSAIIEYLVPRWDIYLFHESLSNDAGIFQRVKYFLLHVVLFRSVGKRHKPVRFDPKDILRFRLDVLKLIRSSRRHKSAGPDDDCYLILERSEKPEYYNKTVSEYKNYGIKKRSLKDIKGLLKYLNSKGIRAMVFEPGVLNLVDQIYFFSKCKGIIGIRGAEFANVFWMQAKRKAIMINHRSSLASIRSLARLADIDLKDIPAKCSFPQIDPDQINTLLSDEYQTK